jgi:hypothetical protein
MAPTEPTRPSVPWVQLAPFSSAQVLLVQFGSILAQTKALRPWGRVKPISPKSEMMKKSLLPFDLSAGKYFYHSHDRPEEPKRTSSVSSIL